MPGASRTFRVFVSSTFLDLKSERDALQRLTYPRLVDLCARHGAAFQAIDLRWGISEEASLDQRTMDVCLSEVQRSRAVSPRPNFIILLGERYGWLPPPPHIPDAHFQAMLRWLTPDQRELLRDWYTRDSNAVPPSWDLRPRRGNFAEPAVWSQVEQQLHLTVRAGATRAGLTQLAYTASAVEQEIFAGALDVADADEHVFAFIRSIDGLPEGAAAAGFADTDPWSREAAEQLRARLRRRLPDHIYEYRTRWADDAPSQEYLPRLADDVYQALEQVILHEIETMRDAGPLEHEIEAHQRFGREILTLPDSGRVASAGRREQPTFIGRDEAIERITAYLAGDDAQPLGVFAEGGSGKSTLLARVAEAAQARWPDATVISRFIGASPDSVDGRLLLHGLCLQLAQLLGQEDAAVPEDYVSLIATFRTQLAVAGSRAPTLVFLDALDQLSDEHFARNLGWLPRQLPAQVRLVVSTRPGECLERLQAMDIPLLELGSMTLREGDALLGSWLVGAGRTLQHTQRRQIMEGFAACSRPLYLRLAFERACGWSSDEQVGPLARDIPNMVRDLFAELSRPENHGGTLVHHAVGLLAASRFGLGEDELADVLSTDPVVMAEFRARARPEWFDSVDRLPVVVWSRLRLGLQPYLCERHFDGATLLGFYHRELQEVAEHDHLAGREARRRHTTLAAAFRRRADTRGMRELPYHLIRAQRWGEVRRTLTDPGFLERKAAALGAELVLEDFLHAYGATGVSSGLRTALSRTLARIAVADSDGIARMLDPASLHALLAYRNDRSLYMQVLDYCTRASFIARHVTDRPTRTRRLLEFRSNQANLLRRLGGPDNLQTAAQKLRDALAAHPTADPDPESARILSSIQYDLAYIDHLTGQWQRAIDGLEASANTALNAGDETRGWISSCVAANVAFYAGRLDAGAYREVLTRALGYFEAAADTSLLAQRWIMNVHSSLFDLAFISGDQAGAEAQFALLQGDRWLAQFGMELRIAPLLNARMFLLRGDWQQACRCYQNLLGAELARPEGPSSAEGLARNFLEYGQALLGAGDPEQARAIWEIGLRCPDHAGNWFWRHQIERILREHH